MWNEIVNQDDIQGFMESFGYFHDGCIRELKYASNIFVNEELTICPADDGQVLKIIFQRQYESPKVIEMEFRELVRLQMCLEKEWYDSILFGATMIKKNGYIYWCDSDNLLDDDLVEYKGTLICASKVRWRIVDEYIGKDEIYINS